MEKLRVGVIGCGAIGKTHIERITNKIPNAEVTAVADFFQQAADTIATKYNCTSFLSGEELINSDSVDAILVSSADPSHAGYVLRCIEEGKRVFCEKPLANTAEDCEKIMAEEVKAGKKLVQVGFMRRYDPGYVEMKKVLDSGELGDSLMIHACHRNVYQPPETFTTNMGITGVAIHEIDISRWLLNDEYVSAQVLTVRQNKLTDGNYLNPQLVMLETRNGARIVVEVQCSCAYAYDIRCEVVAEKGVISLPDPPRAVLRSDASVKTPLMTDWSQRFIEAYDIELQAWVNAVLAGTNEGPSAWDGYVAAVTADALISSRETGTPVNINLIEKPSLY